MNAPVLPKNPNPGSHDLETEIFTTLSNPRRRHAIKVLKVRDGAISVRDLSRSVASLENDAAALVDVGAVVDGSAENRSV